MEVARKIGAKYYVECSAKTGEGGHRVFVHATREALRISSKPSHKPSKSFKPFKGLLKAPSKGLEEGVESESAPLLDDAEEQKLKKLLLAATSAAPQRLKRFRLLIIGKTGCGKTTILSKVNTRVISSRALGK